MTDIPNTQPDSRETTILDAPDRMVKVREMFGIDSDMEVPAFSEADERVPDLDPAYVFDADTTLAVLAGGTNAFLPVFYGGMPLDHALTAGMLTASGDIAAATRFSKLFALPEKIA